MEFRIFLEPHEGTTYEQQVAAAQVGEEVGYDGFFRSDHLMAQLGQTLSPTESWVTLAGIARETETIPLGTLMTAGTFRSPALLAIEAAQVDEMSRGRLELGFALAWWEPEHLACGVPFLPVSEQFDQLDEQMAIVKGVWATPPGGTFDHAGAHYRLQDAPPLPGAPKRSIPIILSGRDTERIPSLAAAHADEYNANFASPEVTAKLFAGVRMACEQAGRDPASLRLSVTQTIVTGENDAEVERRGGFFGAERRDFLRRELYGTRPRVVDLLGRYQELGADRVYLQFIDAGDLEFIRYVATDVIAELRGTGAPATLASRIP